MADGFDSDLTPDVTYSESDIQYFLHQINRTGRYNITLRGQSSYFSDVDPRNDIYGTPTPVRQAARLSAGSGRHVSFGASAGQPSSGSQGPMTSHGPAHGKTYGIKQTSTVVNSNPQSTSGTGIPTFPSLQGNKPVQQQPQVPSLFGPTSGHSSSVAASQTTHVQSLFGLTSGQSVSSHAPSVPSLAGLGSGPSAPFAFQTPQGPPLTGHSTPLVASQAQGGSLFPQNYGQSTPMVASQANIVPPPPGFGFGHFAPVSAQVSTTSLTLPSWSLSGLSTTPMMTSQAQKVPTPPGLGFGHYTPVTTTHSNNAPSFTNQSFGQFNPMHTLTGAAAMQAPSLAGVSQCHAAIGSRIPNLPPFSGEGRKDDSDFDVWKYDVSCLLKEGVYPQYSILEAMRRSLRGKARSVLVHLGELASVRSIVEELEGIYGNVSSVEHLKGLFYSASQNEKETVADYSVRLEQMLGKVDMHLDAKQKNDMLCSKLWSGLHNHYLKNVTRFKYETVKNFSELRRELRTVEQEMSLADAASGPQAKPVVTCASQGMTLVETKLLQQLEGLKMDYNNLKARFEKQDAVSTNSTADPEPATQPAQNTFNAGKKKNHKNRSQNENWRQGGKNEVDQSDDKSLNQNGPPQKGR